MLDFKNTRRLKTRAEFQACYEHGSRHFTKSFALFVLPKADGGSPRIGLTVSRKLGNAVARNRIKRVAREFFRLHRHEIKGPLDIVFVPKRALRGRRVSLALLEKELSPLLDKLNELLPEWDGTA